MLQIGQIVVGSLIQDKLGNIIDVHPIVILDSNNVGIGGNYIANIISSNPDLIRFKNNYLIHSNENHKLDKDVCFVKCNTEVYIKDKNIPDIIGFATNDELNDIIKLSKETGMREYEELYNLSKENNIKYFPHNKSFNKIFLKNKDDFYYDIESRIVDIDINSIDDNYLYDIANILLDNYISNGIVISGENEYHNQSEIENMYAQVYDFLVQVVSYWMEENELLPINEKDFIVEKLNQKL